MPRDRADYRAARAVLSAPYPLPIVITRDNARIAQRAPADPSGPLPPFANVPAVLGSDVTDPGNSTNTAAFTATGPAQPKTQPGISMSGTFPTFTFDWRRLGPAIPPVPYPTRGPTDVGTNQRSWSVKLLTTHTGSTPRNTDSGGDMSGIEEMPDTKVDSDMMSGIEEGPSTELSVVKKINALDLSTRAASTLVPPPTVGLLTSTMESNVSKHFFDSTPRRPPHKFDFSPLTKSHVSKDHDMEDKSLDIGTKELTGGVSLRDIWTPSSPSSGFFEWSSDGEADEEDIMGSPVSDQVITPEEPLRRPDKVFTFYGQTGLVPFAANPDYNVPGLADYESEAPSTKTIIRIPRNRYAQAEAARELAQLDRRHGKKATVDHMMETRFGFADPSRYAPVVLTPKSYMSGTEEVSAVCEPPFSPMWVDPRSASVDSMDPSWPRLDTGRPIEDESMVELTPRAVPYNLDRYDLAHTTPVRETIRDLRLPLGPHSRPIMLPSAKACHNFLLARKVHAARKSRQIAEYNRRLFEQAQRDGMVLEIPGVNSRSGRQHLEHPSHSYLDGSRRSHGSRERKREAYPDLHAYESRVDAWEGMETQSDVLGLLMGEPNYRPASRHSREQHSDHTARPSPRKRRRERSPESYAQVPHAVAPTIARPTFPMSTSHYPSSTRPQPQHHSSHPIAPSSATPSDLLPAAQSKKARREPRGPKQLSSYNLMLVQAGDVGKELREEEKAARRAEWVRSERERVERQQAREGRECSVVGIGGPTRVERPAAKDKKGKGKA